MYTIFLSSTFNDMQNERDAFHRVILPRLNGVLAEYGQSAQLCDLRWGVDTSGDGEAESTRKILDVCFDSIKTSIPFFSSASVTAVRVLSDPPTRKPRSLVICASEDIFTPPMPIKKMLLHSASIFCMAFAPKCVFSVDIRLSPVILRLVTDL